MRTAGTDRGGFPGARGGRERAGAGAGGSESLPGRLADHELGGFGLDETGSGRRKRLWLRGGFPRSFTARSDAASMEWRRSFVQTYLERDVLDAGLRMPPAELRRFRRMLTHGHGQRWNASEFGRAFGTRCSASTPPASCTSVRRSARRSRGS